MTTETATPNTDRLLRWLESEVATEREFIAEMAAKMTAPDADVARLFDNKGDSLLTRSADLTVVATCLMELKAVRSDPQALVMVAQRLLRFGTREAFQVATRPERSTSPMANLTRTEVAARWARVIHPEHPDSLGEHLAAIAGGKV